MVSFHYNKKWVKWLLGTDAITIGNSIYTWQSELSNYLRKHELKHVEQFNRYKPFMIIRFSFVYLWEWIKVGFRYSKVKFEIEAKKAGLEE